MESDKPKSEIEGFIDAVAGHAAADQEWRGLGRKWAGAREVMREREAAAAAARAALLDKFPVTAEKPLRVVPVPGQARALVIRLTGQGVDIAVSDVDELAKL